MGATSSGQPLNSELPKGKVDPDFCRVWNHSDNNSQSRLTLKRDGSYSYVVRLFEETHLISTTKQKGEWGRFSRYIVLKGKSLYFGFGCGADDSKNWMEFLGSIQFTIQHWSLILEGNDEFPAKQFYDTIDHSVKRYISEWGTSSEQTDTLTTIKVKDDNTFDLVEVLTSSEIHYRGEWFADTAKKRGIFSAFFFDLF